MHSDSGYEEHVYKGQPVIRDSMAGTESFPFNLVKIRESHFGYKGQLRGTKKVKNMIIIVIFPCPLPYWILNNT